jgi:large subunit ribosomal protein L29
MKTLKRIKELSDVELEKREKELRQELYNLRFQNHTGQLENPMRMRLSRRELAKVLTIRKERAGAGASAQTHTGEEGR